MRVLGSTPSGGTYVTKSDVKSALRRAASDAGMKPGMASRDRVILDGKEVDRYRLPVTGGFLEAHRLPGSPIVFHPEAATSPPQPSPKPTPAAGPAVKTPVMSVDASEPAVQGSAALEELADLVRRVPPDVLEGLGVALGLPRQASPDAFASAAVSGGMAALSIEVLSAYLEESDDLEYDADEDSDGRDEDEGEGEDENEDEDDAILDALMEGTDLSLDDLAGALSGGADDDELAF